MTTTSDPNVSVNINENVKTEKTSAPTTPSPLAKQVQPTNVNVPFALIVQVSNIIDNLAQRGVFRAKEMVAVGTVYNELQKVVSANT